jgi:hypothetical protein
VKLVLGLAGGANKCPNGERVELRDVGVKPIFVPLLWGFLGMGSMSAEDGMMAVHFRTAVRDAGHLPAARGARDLDLG